MNPKKTVAFAINTVEDLLWNGTLFDSFFKYLESIINFGHEITFHRIGRNEILTTIKDISHLNNFKKGFEFPR